MISLNTRKTINNIVSPSSAVEIIVSPILFLTAIIGDNYLSDFSLGWLKVVFWEVVYTLFCIVVYSWLLWLKYLSIEVFDYFLLFSSCYLFFAIVFVFLQLFCNRFLLCLFCFYVCLFWCFLVCFMFLCVVFFSILFFAIVFNCLLYSELFVCMFFLVIFFFTCKR